MVRTHGPFASVVDLGGRNVNGSVRPFFNAAQYTAIDLEDGPGVTVVGDARTWRPETPVECVVCCEVLEHAERPEEIIAAAWEYLEEGGRFIFTAACPPRAPHSGHDGGPLHPGEHYANVDPSMLERWLKLFSEAEVEVHHSRGDVYAVAVK